MSSADSFSVRSKSRPPTAGAMAGAMVGAIAGATAAAAAATAAGANRARPGERSAHHLRARPSSGLSSPKASRSAAASRSNAAGFFAAC